MCRSRDFMEDVKEQYKEMRDEFMAGLEDRKFLSLADAQAKAMQARSACVWPAALALHSGCLQS